MFSKPPDHQEVDNSGDSPKTPESISQKHNNQADNPDTNNKVIAGTKTQLAHKPAEFKKLAIIHKASTIITQNLPVHQIAQRTLELCREIILFSDGNILLTHSGKWQAIQKNTRKEFEVVFNALRKEGLVELMFQEQECLRHSPNQLLLNDSYSNTREILSFPMVVDSDEIGACLLLMDKECPNFSASDLETIKIIVNQAAIAIKYQDTQKQLTKQERIFVNLKQLLIRALKMVLVGELARGITHEINNPLQIILGKIQMAMIGINYQDVLKHIEKQTLQIASLVRTISDISKNRTKNSFEIIEINSFLKHTIELVRGQIKKRGIRIHLNFDDDSIPIHNNSDYLRQLILNSTLNAKKRMSNGGQLFVSTSVINGDIIQIEFRDDGPKIEGNFNKNILNYAVDMDKLNQINVDFGEITNILLAKEIGGAIDYQRHESFGNKIIIRIPQNTQSTP